MALFTLNFESQYLTGNTQVSVIMPDRPRTENAKDFYDTKKYKVLWLLHGTYGDSTDWIRHTNIENYACLYAILGKCRSIYERVEPELCF